jgi:antitoxin component of RelBE/YafQ-DinJ toxin-antitoxin module
MKRNPVLNLKIEPELAHAIQQFCERFGMTKSVAIRELIRRGLEAAKQK